MIAREIQLIDLFDTASKTCPPEVLKKSWRKLAGAIYGAMRRGRSVSDIWEALSLDLQDAIRNGSKKEKREAEILMPYVTQFVDDVNTLATGEKISLE
jgi:hypothetical protein